MSTRNRRKSVAALAGGIGLAAVTAASLLAPATAAPAAPAAPPGPKVIVTGLDNPRQLSTGANGGLYVAEAGHGGPDCMGTGEEASCVGLTSKVSWIVPLKGPKPAKARAQVSGYASGAGADGSFATGIDGVSLRNGRLFFVTTWAPPGTTPPAIEKTLGRLFVKPPGKNSKPRAIANIGAAETKHNPDGKEINPNPYAVLALPDRVLVADAGGNTVWQWKNRKLTVWHVFPDIKKDTQFVPTSLALGTDGNVYVGGLGGGEAPGNGRVVRLTVGGKVLKTWGGFTGVSGVAFHKGSLYVSELFGGGGPTSPPGQVTVVRPSERSSTPVPFPAGIVVDAQARVWVVANSTAPANGPGGGGQIWRFAGL